jgi:hypothetical protein
VVQLVAYLAKEAIKLLPEASQGELWTTNEYVGT